MKNFTEKTRVQIPAILHLIKLGYTYLSKNETKFDPETNIIQDIFIKQIKAINPNTTDEDALNLLNHIKSISNYDDLGRTFYQKLTDRNGLRLIDFSNRDNNSFHVMYEVPFVNGEEEFRPDVTLFINGIPVAFLEVKVPDNDTLIKAESVRMSQRFQQKLFNRFLNIIQIMAFSNNMEYETDAITQPLQGTFYCCRARKKAKFSTFREENKQKLIDASNLLLSEDDITQVLKDTNSIAIKGSLEFQTNLDGLKPTNRLCTSLFSKDRILYLLNYGICYFDEYNEEDKTTQTVKHIMRYPQLFASYAISKKLDEGVDRGVIWHTQGSGKTELAYYQIKILTDYYAKKNIVPKFYFIVDRLQLFKQAVDEMSGRCIKVNTASSKKEFSDTLKNDTKNTGITIVNIQKFSDEEETEIKINYDTKIQRIYFLDEAHRSYNIKGQFLANLYASDRNSIKIALTGTPIVYEESDESTKNKSLLKRLRNPKINTTDIFGNYIHTYYYDLSISDGYTLRLIREDILTTYKDKIDEIVKQIKILSDSIDKKDIKSHPKYCEEFTNYIVNDFEDFQIQNKNVDGTNLNVASMIICDSNQQAKEVYNSLVNKGKKALLILYDWENKEWRENEIKDFKYTNKYDYLVVDDMLLTGFDCRRVKKLYLGKIIKAHTLLQALTRANRPFGKMQYGYIVDFANILDEFKKVNEIYATELKKLHGEVKIDINKILLTDSEIEKIVERTEEALFIFDTSNLENFQSQIDNINNLKQINTLKRIIDDAKSVYNVAKLNDNVKTFTLDINKINELSKMIDKRVKALRFKELDSDELTALNILNEYMEMTEFSFIKLGEKELVIADKQREVLRKVKREFEKNFDNKDPQYVNAYEELKKLLKKSNMEEVSQELIDELNKLYNNVFEINNYNENLSKKYFGDKKFTRIHKRLLALLPINEKQLLKVLLSIKNIMDTMIENNENVLASEDYIEKEVASKAWDIFDDNNIDVELNTIKNISHIIVSEYLNQYKGALA